MFDFQFTQAQLIGYPGQSPSLTEGPKTEKPQDLLKII